jgi:hypothetical protein
VKTTATPSSIITVEGVDLGYLQDGMACSTLLALEKISAAASWRSAGLGRRSLAYGWRDSDVRPVERDLERRTGRIGQLPLDCRVKLHRTPRWTIPEPDKKNCISSL